MVAVGVPAAGLRGGWRDYCIVNAPERSGLGALVVLRALGWWWPPLPLPPLLRNGGEGDLLWDVVPGVALVPRLPQATF